jgi:hypothetical protein
MPGAAAARAIPGKRSNHIPIFSPNDIKNPDVPAIVKNRPNLKPQI